MGYLAQMALKVSLRTFARKAGYTLDPWQLDVLESQAPGILLNVTRQGGKSTVAGLVGSREAVCEAGSTVLVVSRAQRQSQLLFRKILDVFWRLDLGDWMAPDAESRLHLELPNGSQIAALPGSEETVRGFSAVNLLLIDEAARVPDDLHSALRPMLATSQGRELDMSTPWGRRGWWYESIRDRRQSGWVYHEIPATECPRITPEFLAEEYRILGPMFYSQEYECQFVDAAGAAFRSEDVEASVKSYAVLPGIRRFT